MESITGNKEFVRNLNTQGCCFLCLEAEDLEFRTELNEERRSTSIGHIFRYLQMGDNLLTDTISSTPLKFEKIQAKFCESCGKIVSRFSILVQQLEKVQMEMNYFLKRINQCIFESTEDSCRFQTYSKRMTSDSEALSQLVFVDKLRKALANKCKTRQVDNRSLCIKLKRAHVLPKLIEIFKEEVSDTSCFNDEEFLNSSSLEPSPSSQSPEIETEDLKINFIPISQNVSTTACKKEGAAETLPKSAPLKDNTMKDLDFTRDSKSGKYLCPTCKKGFVDLHNARVHYEAVHIKKKWKCDICKIAVFTRQNNLYSHKKICLQTLQKRVSREEFDFPCSTCGKKYRTRQLRQKHEKFVHSISSVSRYHCCNQKFETPKSWTAHRVRFHHKQISRRCKYCNREFTRGSSCIRHEKICCKKISIKIERNNSSFACCTCGKMFSKEKYLKRHQRRVHAFKQN